MVFSRFNSHGYNSLIIHHIKNCAEGRQRLFSPFYKYFCQNKMPSSKAKELIWLSSYRHLEVFVFQKPCYNQWKLERHSQNSIFSVPKHYGKTYSEIWCWLILTYGSLSVGYVTFLKKKSTAFFHQITLFMYLTGLWTVLVSLYKVNSFQLGDSTVTLLHAPCKN